MSVETITLKLKEEYEKQQYKPYEIVITIFALVEKGNIAIDDVKPTIYNVFSRDRSVIYDAVKKAVALTDSSLIKEILQ